MRFAERREANLQRRLGVIFIMLIPAATPFALYYIYERPQVSQRFFLQLSIIIGAQLLVILSLFRRSLDFSLFSPAAEILSRQEMMHSKWRIKKIDLFVVLYGVIVILSSLLKLGESSFNLKEATFPLSCLVYFLLIRALNPNIREVQKLLLLLLFVGLINAGYGVAQYFGFEFLGYLAEQKRGKLNVLAFMGHPNFLSAAIVPLVYLSFIVFIRTTSLLLRIFSFITATLIAICVILAGARGAWLGSLISALFFYANLHFLPFMAPYRRYAKILFASFIVMIALVVVLLVIPNPLITKKYSFLERLTARSEITARFYAWCIARDMFLKNPLLGIGYGGFTAKFWDYVVEFQENPEHQIFADFNIRFRGVAPGQVHNELLEVAAETGFLGLIAFLLILIETFRKGLGFIYSRREERGERREEKIVCLCLLAAIVFLLIDSMFNFTFQLPLSAILFWLLLAQSNNLTDRGGEF